MFKDISSYIAAAAALGTAAFALVDASKAVRGGVSNRGFTGIDQTVRRLVAEPPSTTAAQGAPPTPDILATLKANWINGTALTDQKTIAKTLIKLRLGPDNATALANTTGVDAGVLTTIASKIRTGDSLTKAESDVYGRFDLILTTLLDEAYQRADQAYRNTCKVAAAGVAVVLAVCGGWAQVNTGLAYWWSQDLAVALLTGLIATPLAPIAKDLATAVTAGANAIQAFGK